MLAKEPRRPWRRKPEPQRGQHRSGTASYSATPTSKVASEVRGAPGWRPSHSKELPQSPERSKRLVTLTNRGAAAESLKLHSEILKLQGSSRKSALGESGYDDRK